MPAYIYNRDPYWIQVKYPATCHKCKGEILRGARAFYYPKGGALYCEKGGCGNEAAADFADCCAAEY